LEWYKLGKGPLSTLRNMLNDPLGFDPRPYIDHPNNPKVFGDYETAAKLLDIYNEVRLKLYPKLGSVVNSLKCSARLSSLNYSTSRIWNWTEQVSSSEL